MTTKQSPLLYDKRDHIAFITLNRPQVINAFNVAMRDSLWSALEAVRDDPDVRAVVLSGAGEKGFCAGADLSEFGSAPSQHVARQVRFERGVWELWLSIPKPFVGALHGYTFGSGMEMALLCDLRLASQDGVFGLPEVGLGMIPAAGGTQTFPRQAGLSAGLEALLTARRYTAADALQLGLVHGVVSRDRLLGTAAQWAGQLTRLDPQVVGLAKRTLREGADLPLPQALELEMRLAAQAFSLRGATDRGHRRSPKTQAAGRRQA
ncbi:MAG: enoyl-CoA hydratase/isomerase family protein [Dehalococcoidia bacterium]|nr:enoyl-CoA hydratase/isomerase family protein [Dehalococcoidia bacterium]